MKIIRANRVKWFFAFDVNNFAWSQRLGITQSSILRWHLICSSRYFLFDLFPRAQFSMVFKSNYAIAIAALSAKPKLIAPCIRDFHRALGKFQLITRNSEWLIALVAPVVIGRSNNNELDLMVLIVSQDLASLLKMLSSIGYGENKFSNTWKHSMGLKNIFGNIEESLGFMIPLHTLHIPIVGGIKRSCS